MALCDQLEAGHLKAAEAHEQLVSQLLSTLTGSKSPEDFSQNWKLIAEHFDTLFTTESSVEALKQTILQLAVMGKLVRQDPGDEPASELLKRIQTEKAKLVAEGKIRKSSTSPEYFKIDSSKSLPNGWAWAPIQELSSIIGGSTPSMAKSEFWDGDIPWVSPKDMHDGLITKSELYITKKALKETNLEIIEIGSILIVGRSGILKRKLPAQVTGVQCTINQDLKAVTPIQPMYDRYLQLIFWGNEHEILTADVKQGTTVQSLVYEKLFNRPFAIPPLAEQYRILSQVDSLTALCDRLKVRITDGNRLQQKMADVLAVPENSPNQLMAK